jgi:ubiquinone/menaquinone biosynthesis C-methylase UbiE
MVKLANEVNKQAVKEGQANIVEGSVTNLPYDNEIMDVVTANETVQFWPDIEKSFKSLVIIMFCPFSIAE